MGKGQQWRTQQKQLPAKCHMTLSQVPAMCEKNIFHLFRFTQPVENNTPESRRKFKHRVICHLRIQTCVDWPNGLASLPASASFQKVISMLLRAQQDLR